MCPGNRAFLIQFDTDFSPGTTSQGPLPGARISVPAPPASRGCTSPLSPRRTNGRDTSRHRLVAVCGHPGSLLDSRRTTFYNIRTKATTKQGQDFKFCQGSPFFMPAISGVPSSFSPHRRGRTCPGWRSRNRSDGRAPCNRCPSFRMPCRSRRPCRNDYVQTRNDLAKLIGIIVMEKGTGTDYGLRNRCGLCISMCI